MTIERLPSALPSPPPRVMGMAVGAQERHVFEIQGAERLSLSVRFHGKRPLPGAIFSDVTVGIAGQEERISLGRCRYEVSSPKAARVSSGLDMPPPSRRAPAFGAFEDKLVPLDVPINCRELFRHGRLVLIEETFDQLPLLFARKESIAPAFQRYTADLVYDLRIYRSLFDDIDGGLVSESAETRAEVERAIIKGPGRRFMRFFSERLLALEEIVRPFSRQEHERHGFYFRRQVWDVILTSPILARTNIRPRGYGGDWVVMQYLYQNDYIGPTLFGKLLHKHVVETTSADAVRNRRSLIARTIDSERRAHGASPGSRFNFLSVACGPATEVDDIFLSPEDCDAYECALLDQDEEALREAAAAIEALEEQWRRPVIARFIRQSVRTMLRTPNFAEEFGTYRLVYAMGLFDYLNTPVAKAVLQKLYELLEPGGLMVIGNFHVGNPTRWYMEYWADWTLIYRTEEDLLGLASELPGAECSISFEEKGCQMFLMARKATR